MLLLHVRLYKLLMLSNGMDFSSSLYLYTILPTSRSNLFVLTSFEKKSKGDELSSSSCCYACKVQSNIFISWEMSMKIY